MAEKAQKAENINNTSVTHYEEQQCSYIGNLMSHWAKRIKIISFPLNGIVNYNYLRHRSMPNATIKKYTRNACARCDDCGERELLMMRRESRSRFPENYCLSNSLSIASRVASHITARHSINHSNYKDGRIIKFRNGAT